MTCLNSSNIIISLFSIIYKFHIPTSLSIPVAPTVIATPTDVILTEGESAIFTCNVMGRPRPSIEWGYSSQQCPATSSPDFFSLINETTGDYSVERVEIGDRILRSTLTVLTTLPSDTGCYACFAENEVVGGRTFANASLNVEGKRRITSFK